MVSHGVYQRLKRTRAAAAVDGQKEISAAITISSRLCQPQAIATPAVVTETPYAYAYDMDGRLFATYDGNCVICRASLYHGEHRY